MEETGVHSPPILDTAAPYITRFKLLIARDWSANTLSHAALPDNRQVLRKLSRHMADEVYNCYRLGFAPTLRPLAHPYFLFWLPEHELNYAVEAWIRQEGREKWNEWMEEL